MPAETQRPARDLVAPARRGRAATPKLAQPACGDAYARVARASAEAAARERRPELTEADSSVPSRLRATLTTFRRPRRRLYLVPLVAVGAALHRRCAARSA
jgi:hypothetical protein